MSDRWSPAAVRLTVNKIIRERQMTPIDARQDLLFPEDCLVVYANVLLGIAGSEIRVVGAARTRPDRIVMSSIHRHKHLRLVAPVLEFAPGVIGAKSILRETPLGGGALWDGDGSPTQGCDALASFGRTGPRLAASRKALSGFMRSAPPQPYQDEAGFRNHVEHLLEEMLSRGTYGDGHDLVGEGFRRPLPEEAEMRQAV